MPITQEPQMKSFAHSNYGNEKANKSKQLNPSMSIAQRAQDQYENKIHNVAGGNPDGE